MKKIYVKPTVEVVKLQQSQQLLAGSNYGVNEGLQDIPVDDGW